MEFLFYRGNSGSPGGKGATTAEKEHRYCYPVYEGLAETHE
jgi:hypothetical protein